MPKLTFGVFIPQGWNGELAKIPDAQAKWRRMVEIAQLAESLGFDSLWVNDHLQNLPAPVNEAVFECWTALAALSQHTSRIKLGQLVTCASYRNPALLAKITANLDVISGGRLIWGVGAGWVQREFDGYGYEFRSAAERIALLRETVEIVTALWREPEVTYRGQYFTLNKAQCDPKPLQQPRPEVLIGGSGMNKTLRVVAALADMSNFAGDPALFGARCGALRRHCDDVGRDYDQIRKTWTPELFIRETEADLAAARERNWSIYGVDYDSWAETNLVGTPDQIVERMLTYRDLGCTDFIPWCADYPDVESMHLLAGQVVPVMRTA